MPNTNFVPNWTFERTLPSPFDSYSGKSAVMKDIASKYCNQPKKRATLHSATLQAVFSYMNLENPPAGKAEEELGAIGSQANNFTIAEYPSRTGLLHVVVYNRMTGKFIAGKYEKPLDLDSKPEPYQFKKDEDSGSALYFALMPTFLSDDEFNEKYQELKQHRDDGFPDLPKAAETAAVLCDNVYRRIRYGDSLPIGNIKVDTPATHVECYHILEGNDSFLIQVDQSFIHTQRRRSGGAAQYKWFFGGWIGSFYFSSNIMCSPQRYGLIVRLNNKSHKSIVL